MCPRIDNSLNSNTHHNLYTMYSIIMPYILVNAHSPKGEGLIDLQQLTNGQDYQSHTPHDTNSLAVLDNLQQFNTQSYPTVNDGH